MEGLISSPASGREKGFLDNNHRKINYLRLSMTDRCNLRCIYCMPEEGVNFLPHNEILTYEEMLRLVNLCVLNGIRKVRLTGGEPLVRKGIIPFIERLCQIEGLEDITLTTNGVLLKKFARPLRECGICRVNVSMDTLRPERFLKIARKDYFERVWEGIEEAESAGFNPIKINVVAMRGTNDDEILDFARLTFRKPYHVRFIEMMPVGEKNGWSFNKFLSIGEILNSIKALGPVIPVESAPLDGPAQRYKLEGSKGEIGFIGALSNHFCEKCNRLRLTADGHLRGCLFSEDETDIKTPLREGKDDSHLLEIIRNAILNKPRDHGLDIYGPRKCVRSMNSIGG
ncbi:MAG: GTP 3',8-cyclase MoaA [Deltaproteobacteria bacterium]|nr:GTP 3',8-cyclase MoaA [Deltaproteobacteria bacterium]